MKKADLKAIAASFFKGKKEVTELFITTDGQAFVNENAAKLHANTNPTKKKFKVETFTNGVVEISKDEIEWPLDEKALKAIKLPELQKIADDLKINVQELDTKQKLADAIAELKAKA
jgi:hypothetical protein